MPYSRLETTLNMLALWGVSLVLLVAFQYQLVLHELPCPLCLLQRGCFVSVGIGFMLNVRFRPATSHYGLILIGAVLGAATSARQVLLHIVPGSGAYGSALFGLHFYTWACLTFVGVILATAVMLLLPHGKKNGLMSGQPSLPTPGLSGWLAMGLFVLMVVGNLASTLLECGFGQCADNPTWYLWLGG